MSLIDEVQADIKRKSNIYLLIELARQAGLEIDKDSIEWATDRDIEQNIEMMRTFLYVRDGDAE